MNHFLSRYAHWLLLLLVGSSFVMGFTLFTHSVQGVIAGVFGIMGLSGVAYLVFHIEKQRRRETK
ncbi:hypothetical protein [Rossellomorea aquimaris]|jgi:hypothetical protein|uniref:hypothetical protein n=1 Tax=Rossellomorea aquimaris TaxID=189382 RepID=UPI0011E93209|nr:hypothetical protein [Rossellomorea aquimaris]TYS91445.1 hypothetical protein FZC88_04680 [Rossellomorea aquimaris]